MFYALLLGCASLQGDSSLSAARVLYSKAAEAIEAGRQGEATQALEALTRQHPNSPLSSIAIPHLAECYLIAERPLAALDLLETRLRERPSAHCQRTVLLSCRALPRSRESITRIEACLSSLAGSASSADENKADSITEQLSRELARRYEEVKDFSSAIECLERVDVQRLGSDSQFRLPLAWAHHELSQGNTAKALELLEALLKTKLTYAQQAAIRFELSDAYTQHGESKHALEQLDQLASLASSADNRESAPPVWAATVQLRRAEWLLNADRARDARDVLQAALETYPDYAKVHELHFLLARCAIADVNFESALEHLQAVVDSTALLGSEPVARAIWMQGEVKFLQREFQQALALYERAIEIKDCPQWQARSLLQAGKCLELLGHPLQALVTYQRLRNEFGITPTTNAPAWAQSLCNQADERIALLNIGNNNQR